MFVSEINHHSPRQSSIYSQPTSKGALERFSSTVAKAAGSSTAFLLAFAVVLLWALSGPMFGYSEDWQLVINTGTTIVTFLMVFLIQEAQNKESLSCSSSSMS